MICCILALGYELIPHSHLRPRQPLQHSAAAVRICSGKRLTLGNRQWLVSPRSLTVVSDRRVVESSFVLVWKIIVEVMLRIRHRFSQALRQHQTYHRGHGGQRFNSNVNVKVHLAAASLSATLSTLAFKAHCEQDIPVYVAPVVPQPQEILATSPVLAVEDEIEEVDSSYWGYLVRQTKKALTNIGHGARYLERILTYLVVGAPLAGLMPANYVLGSTFPELENATWGYLVWAIQRLGPCFIKMAQWASTRPDLFPPKLIEKIEKFQDDVQISYPMSVIENTLRSAFGDEWKDRLVLSPKPLGTGSVAQVFQGLLKSAGASSEGVQVAIKMIHPHVEQLVRTDMELLSMLADWVDKMPSMEIFALGDTVKDFAECMNQQLDLRLEASHLVKFAKKFANEKWALFPKPVEGFVTRNVMVETLMEGTPISHFMNLPSEVGSATHKLKMKLSDLGTRLILKMIFFDNYIHGDLHPGTFSAAEGRWPHRVSCPTAAHCDSWC